MISIIGYHVVSIDIYCNILLYMLYPPTFNNIIGIFQGISFSEEVKGSWSKILTNASLDRVDQLIFALLSLSCNCFMTSIVFVSYQRQSLLCI